jgi:AmmeMemoRadiSam system protein B
MPPLFAAEDGAETPLGELLFDKELRDFLWKELKGREDRWEDNTVEVLLPMVKFFHPHARIVWIRLPAEESSLEAGQVIAEAGKKLGRKLTVLSSTDLTHYGPNYGFSPQGRGEAALKWVREVNDRSFIEALEAGDPVAALSRAENNKAACSAGAVLGALGFAQVLGLEQARLLAYGTSADAELSSRSGEDTPAPDSFVGYAAMAWDSFS